MTTPRRTLGLGSATLDVSALGLGCMGMSEFYGAADEGEATSTIHRALNLGVTRAIHSATLRLKLTWRSTMGSR